MTAPFRMIVAMAVMAIGLCASAAAQANPSLLPLGIRVRMSVSSPAPDSVGHGSDAGSTLLRERIIGTLESATNNNLIVREGKDGPRREVPLASLNLLEVSRGRHSSSGKGALIGMFAGAAGGVTAALVMCNAGNCVNSGTGDLTGVWAGALGLGGGLFGAGIGAIIGGAISTERWEKVSIRDLRVGIGPVGGHVFGLRVGLALH